MITKISFAGQREDRNNVDKLRLQTNALNFNNQRNIKKSIENLSNDSSTKNVNFLMNVAEQIRYGLNSGIIDAKPNNDWKEQLKHATEKSLANNNTDAKESLQARFKQVFENNKGLSDEEKNMLSLRESLLKKHGLKTAIKTSENDNVRNIEKNLNYFVVSSEITTDEKVQVLDKLNKFMSPEYKIDKQLKHKKPQVLGEMLNDLVVKTAEQDMPTIKQVDQRHHGMCAAISIARKAMAYEYKPQYVDIVMQEVSADKTMEVYDISKLGSGEKVRVPKTEIDYDYAEEKGYRIIDAATLQWMNIAGTKGKGDIEVTHFSAFDKKYFDTFHDAHYKRKFGEPMYDAMNDSLRALNKANEKTKKTIKTFENNKKAAMEQKQSERQNAMLVAASNRVIANELKALMPNSDENTIHSTVNELIRLNTPEVKKAKSPFYIVDAEEDVTKKQKIAKFIESKNPAVDKNLMSEKMDNIFNMYSLSTETLEYMNKEIEPKSQKNKMMKYYKPLYEVAAMYRTSVEKGLDIPGNVQTVAQALGLPETATKEDVLKKYEQDGAIVSEEILRGLQTKYNKIAKYAAVVEKAEVKGDNVQIDGLYDISDKEVAALKGVEKDLKDISIHVEADRKYMQEVMEPLLKAQAQQLGLETGSYWVHKEGESGLNRPQQLRIFEQMTGKRFYAEEDLDRTAETIKRSNHSGITASNVYHNDHGWHAMYVADLAQVQVKNPETGKMETKDAIMYDNSWGLAEKKNTWIDSNGLERTDYACGRGGATGYITNPLWQNGTLVDDYKNHPAIIGKGANQEKYRMFTEAILPTSKTLAGYATKKILENIYQGVGENTERLKMLEQQVKDGTVTVQDLNSLKLRIENVDKVQELKKAYSEKLWNSIKSKADWDKVPSNDYAKIVMERAAIASMLDSETMYEFANEIKSEVPNEKAIAKKVYMTALKEFAVAIKRTPIEELNLKEYQVDANAHYGKTRLQLVKDWVDKTYNPADDADFITKMYELKAMSEKDLLVQINKTATPEDLGIRKMTSYEALQAYKNQDPQVGKFVNQFVYTDTLKEVIGSNKIGYEPNELYHHLSKDLSALGLAEQIKPMAKQYYEKYGVLPSMPQYGMYNEENVRAVAKEFIEIVKNNAVIMNSVPEADKKLNAELARKDMQNFVNESIDKVHRNRVLNSFNRLITAAAKNPESQETQMWAKSIENDFARYSILKNMPAVLDEYLNLTATGENPHLAEVYKTYLQSALYNVTGMEIESQVRHAISKGRAHEVGEQILDATVPVMLSNGKQTEMKLGDRDDLVYEFYGNMTELVGAATAATIFNSTAMSERVMTAISNSINFDNLLKSATKPEKRMQFLQVLKSTWEVVSHLSLAKGSVAEQARNVFAQNINNFVKQVSKMAKTV